MATTRGSSKEQSSPPSAAKKGTKRASTAGEGSTPPAKRGRPAKGTKAASSPLEKSASPPTKSASPPAKRGRPPKGKKAANSASPPEKSSSPPVAKRGRGRPKKQKTIEETTDVTADEKEEVNGKTEENGGEKEQAETKEVEMTDANDGAKEETEQEAVDEMMKDVDKIEDDKKVAEQINGDSQNLEDAKKHGDDEHAESKDEAAPKNETNGVKEDEKNAFDEVKADTGEAHEAAEAEQDKKTESISHNNESVIKDSEREAEIPSSILEKGIIYFFFRGRVGIEHPQGIEDVARSYIVLRPIPLGAKLGEGPLEDSGEARLLALPKKMLPKSGRDRFLMFVEKAKSSIKDLREQFAGNEYATKTSGTSHTPAATPFAEGIYAITSTGRESHLAYYLTKPEPSSLGSIQNELGITEKGSFIVSVKNPEAPGPANVTLANPAKYPDDLQKKFRGLRWRPLEPELLEYEHTQFLVIGEARGEFGKAVEEQSADKKDGTKEKPEEEMENLEEEDHARVKHLKEDDPVFADLGLSSKEYHPMQTTW